MGVWFWATHWLFPNLASTDGECFGELENLGLIIWFNLIFLVETLFGDDEKLPEWPLKKISSISSSKNIYDPLELFHVHCCRNRALQFVEWWIQVINSKLTIAFATTKWTRKCWDIGIRYRSKYINRLINEKLNYKAEI